ncbi:MAG: 5-aminolevulinate synthase [Sulfitobacter sp.]
MTALLPFSLSYLMPVVLVILTACGYATATVGMKLSADNHWYSGAIIIMLGLSGAALAEIALLRTANLSLVYLGIIIGETILVLGYAAWLHEGLSAHQIAGAALVVVGFGLVSFHG